MPHLRRRFDIGTPFTGEEWRVHATCSIGQIRCTCLEKGRRKFRLDHEIEGVGMNIYENRVEYDGMEVTLASQQFDHRVLIYPLELEAALELMCPTCAPSCIIFLIFQ